MAASFALIGIAALAAGVAGVLMPAGERVAAVLPLVAGAGVGILTLALRASDVQDPADFAGVFLVGSILGFITTMGTLVLLWRRTNHQRPPPAGERSR